jgi:hypothetical protein
MESVYLSTNTDLQKIHAPPPPPNCRDVSRRGEGGCYKYVENAALNTLARWPSDVWTVLYVIHFLWAHDTDGRYKPLLELFQRKTKQKRKKYMFTVYRIFVPNNSLPHSTVQCETYQALKCWIKSNLFLISHFLLTLILYFCCNRLFRSITIRVHHGMTAFLVSAPVS